MAGSLHKHDEDTTLLEHLSQMADAELGVAEDLGWVIAILCATLFQFKWESWILSMTAGAIAYVVAIYRYRKRAEIAEDNYFKAAGLGKYIKTQDVLDT